MKIVSRKNVKCSRMSSSYTPRQEIEFFGEFSLHFDEILWQKKYVQLHEWIIIIGFSLK